jgi:membrane-associated phospholipid phosphatase
MRRETRRRGLWILLVAGLACFVVLALGYEDDPLAALDEDVARWVASDLPTWLEVVARPFSWAGGWIGLSVLGVVVALVLAWERSWLDLAFFALAVAGSQLAVMLLKDAFERPRPDAGSAVPLPESFAFPSGHAAAGAASFGAVAVLVDERLPSARARRWLWAGVIALGIGVGLSRVALNVHYVTDVLAGWCFGLAWLAACLLVRDALGGATRRRRPSDRSPAS